MGKARLMLVGTFKDGTPWQTALDSAGFHLSKCQTGLEALLELKQTGFDLIISEPILADLSAYQLCAFLRAGQASQALPVIITSKESDIQSFIPQELIQPATTISEEELNQDDSRLVNLIEEQVYLGQQLGWKGEPLPQAFSTLSSCSDAKQGLSMLLDYQLIEALTGNSVRLLTSELETHKQFLDTFFTTVGKITNPDLLGIAIGSLRDPWIAIKGSSGLKEKALNQLVSEISAKLHLTNEPILEIDDKVLESGDQEVEESHLITIPSRANGAGLLLFANYSGKSFNLNEKMVMESLKIQMEPIVELLLAQRELEQFHNREAFNASVDQLTGLYNVQFMLGFLQQQLLFSVRHKLPVGLLIMDIDDFAHVNASFGMQAGDGILMKLGAHLLSATRASDLCARYGGDEFAVVLPNTDLAGAQVLAEKVRLGIEKIVFFEGAQKAGSVLTVSIGCAEFSMDDLNPETILKAAKDALQTAKKNGKNCVAV